MPVFAQFDPEDPLQTGAGEVSVTGALWALNDLGLFPVIAVAALLVIATVLYSRFKK